MNTLPPSAANSSLTVNLGDAPVDGVVAFEITVNSVVLNQSGGGSITVLNTPTRVELVHRSGTVELLSIRNVPQGSYASATLTVASPEVKVISSTTGLPTELNANLTSSTATVNFVPTLNVGTAPMVLNFDFDLAASLVISGSNATITPTFTASSTAIAAQNEQEDENGEVEDIKGRIVSVAGSSFTIAVEQSSQNLTFATNSSTQFEGFAMLSELAAGRIVEVDAVTQSDGSLLATKVEAEDAAVDLEVEGLVTSVTGAPATSFQMVVQEVEATGSTFPALGATITVLLGGTSFRIDDDDVDLSNLSFSTIFSENTLARAQRVEVDIDIPATDNVAADKVKLKEQSLTGTVSAVSTTGNQTTFALLLPADSAFALLTGQTAISVVRQPSTRLKGISGITVNQVVRARGLLFFNGSTYNMVASRVTAP